MAARAISTRRGHLGLDRFKHCEADRPLARKGGVIMRSIWKYVLIATTAVTATQTARAEYVRALGLRCRHIEPLEKWMGSGNQFMEEQLKTRECSWVPENLLVDVERRNGDFVCIRIRGSDETASTVAIAIFTIVLAYVGYRQSRDASSYCALSSPYQQITCLRCA